MRNKLIYFVLALAFCTLCLIYAGSYRRNEKNSDGTFITKEQAIQDYNEMWELLYDNYPFLNIAEKKYSISVSQIEKIYRDKLDELDSDIDIFTFYQLLSESISGFRQLGHLSILSAQRYELNLSSYNIELENHPERLSKYNRFLYSRLTDEKSTFVYEYIKQMESVAVPFERPSAIKKIQVQTEVLNSDTAYIKIDTFRLDDDYKSEGQKLLDFYKEIEGKQTNLIIDVTQNGGGSDTFWMEYIIFPNITANVKNEWPCLMKDGDEVKKFLELSQMDLIDINQVDLTRLDEKDKNELAFCYNAYNVITPDPDHEEKLFSGNIYVLADAYNYSSADSFISMCKVSGFATVVGNYTGGNGLSASPMFIPLKNSGLILQFSFGYALNDDNTCNADSGTKPDYFSKQGSELEKCLQIIESGK